MMGVALICLLVAEDRNKRLQLARLRGFAVENADFEIFLSAK
jgi:hypothetical protein